jgi:hypothetical protein
VGWGLGRELDKADPGYKDWSGLITLLDLPEEMALGAQEALKETGWRTARQPRVYLRNATIRISSREFGIELTTPKVLHMKSNASLDNILDPDFVSGRSSYHPPTDSEYESVALSGSGKFFAVDDEQKSAKLTTGIRLGAERFGILDTPNVPFRLLARDESGKLIANWAAIAPELDRAGISGTELSIVIMRNQGMSRQEILDTAKTPEERKAFQTAYRAVSMKLSRIQLEVFRPFVNDPPRRKSTPRSATCADRPMKPPIGIDRLREPTPRPLRPPLRKAEA